MLQRFRELLSIVLLAALPLHALAVTIGTRVLLGSGHAPWAVLALWKEAVLGIILLVACFEILSLLFVKKKEVLRLDLIDGTAIVLIALGVVVTMFTHRSLELFAFGFKYDFVPIVAFLILRRVQWSDWAVQSIKKELMVMGGIVAAYGIVSFFLPQTFFTWLGYSDLHSLYRPGAPLPAFHQLGGIGLRRIQSTMSGPNQLGIWLLIPWALGITALLRSLGTEGTFFSRVVRLLRSQVATPLLYLLLIGFAMLLTFSRSAWIAGIVVLCACVWMHFSREQFYRASIRLAGASLLLLMLLGIVFPSILFRFASSRDHLVRPLQALHTMAEHPLGLGLGMAGPASNRISDSCVFLEIGSDPTWALEHPDLCVFVNNAQVQPLDRTCSCPFLPENWYLQIGVEMGVIGFLLFLFLMSLLLRHFAHDQAKLVPVFSIVLGISTAALFLHAWEDAAIAYTVWILMAVALRRRFIL